MATRSFPHTVRAIALVLALGATTGCVAEQDDYAPNPVGDFGQLDDPGIEEGDDEWPEDYGDPIVAANFITTVTDDPLDGLGTGSAAGGGMGGSGSGGSGGSGGAAAGGAPPKSWGVDPCKVLKPTIKAKGVNAFGQTVFIGTEQNDVIFGTDGADFIDGKGGRDIICAKDGEDTIFGGPDNDYIDGGAGKDDIDAGSGNDTVHGRAGSDRIHGGPGNDYLSGDLLDDTLFGDAGDDLLLGGHGSDNLHGGDGDDFLRGDTGKDEFVGGTGKDTLSFATASPPGQSGTPGNDGVLVDLNPTKEMKLQVFGDESDPVKVGLATGDGAWEPVLGIEVVIGSPYDDILAGPAGSELIGGNGEDTCNGVGCDDADEINLPSGILVFVDPSSRDPGLVIEGTIWDDQIDVVVTPTGVRITADGPVQPGKLCAHLQSSNPKVVECQVPGDLFYVNAFGDAGGDTITIGNGLGRNLTTHVNGGEDSDVLTGGNGEDVLFTGITGKDILKGNAGDDALLSESSGADQLLPGSQYGGGPDTLDGGPGNDQLVSDYPCGGHTFIAGYGFDIAGFARAGDKQRIHAQLGGDTKDKSPFWGKALNPDRCGSEQKYWTTIKPGFKVLEGAELNDKLYGDDGSNIIWGRGGNDEIRGYGGNDWLDGNLGDDEIWGGAGKDWIHGGGGFDLIHMQDGEADATATCGAGDGKLVDSDPSDKAPDCSGLGLGDGQPL